MEFINSEKGKNKLLLNGHVYTFEKFGTEKKSIRKFDQYKKLKCKERIYSKNNHIVKEIAYNHVLNSGKIKAAIAVNLIKNIVIQNVELSTYSCFN
jgi:hypothetical protein